jgi:drug/metabolite transporter (DMT)-like permease
MANLTDNMRGALLMMGAMGGFVFNDAAMKLISADLSLFQAVFLRSATVSIFVGIMAIRAGPKPISVEKSDRLIVILRTLGEIGGTLCFLTALFNMAIGNVTAILQALPLAVTLAAAFIFGEKVGWRRYTAVAVGFIGMLIIIRPGSDGFSSFSLWAVAALFFIVVRDMSTSRLSSATRSVTVAWWTAASLTIFAGTLLIFGRFLPSWAAWNPVGIKQIVLLLLASGFLTIGYICSVATMRVGEISFVAPFRYTILIWAILLGYFVFGDVPDLPMLIGSSIIVATGVFTFYREQKIRKRLAGPTG